MIHSAWLNLKIRWLVSPHQSGVLDLSFWKLCKLILWQLWISWFTNNCQRKKFQENLQTHSIHQANTKSVHPCKTRSRKNRGGRFSSYSQKISKENYIINFPPQTLGTLSKSFRLYFSFSNIFRKPWKEDRSVRNKPPHPPDAAHVGFSGFPSSQKTREEVKKCGCSSEREKILAKFNKKRLLLTFSSKKLNSVLVYGGGWDRWGRVQYFRLLFICEIKIIYYSGLDWQKSRMRKFTREQETLTDWHWRFLRIMNPLRVACLVLVWQNLIFENLDFEFNFIILFYFLIAFELEENKKLASLIRVTRAVSSGLQVFFYCCFLFRFFEKFWESWVLRNRFANK